ncbi:MAG: hypothetical protein BroJett040_03330 [Oligoflexia bacterium]|nr:MAG: hypothetical protein BroJett040_03330 [Oligoflexia bacterium]
MKKAAFFVFTLNFLLPGLALALTPSSPYKTGEQVCLSYQNEHGVRVQVPINYDEPHLGTTSIYAWTFEPFNSNKPTVLVFFGGPGSSAHDSKEQYQYLKDWNIILFDQRGVACSRPETATLIDDHNYYRSESIARDGAEILKSFGAHQVSIWGHSYGTVPATIFASFFPEKTRALILEGVIYDGGPALWQPPHKLKLIQKFFNQLPANLKVRILQLSAHPQLDPFWFSDLVKYLMYSKDWEKLTTHVLTGFFEQEEASLISMLQGYGRGSEERSRSEDSEEFGAFTFLHIACREFDARQEYANRLAYFDKGRLYPAKYTAYADECEKRKIPIKLYRATDYPLTVPVYYFNGTTDGATEAPAAIRHYKNVAQGPAQLFLVQDSGHVPVSDLNENGQFHKLFSRVLSGEKLTKEDISNFNDQSELDIRFTEHF